jgi:fructokinase
LANPEFVSLTFSRERIEAVSDSPRRGGDGRRTMPGLIGAVEAGGTKFRIATVDEHLNVVDEIRIPTTTPLETLQAATAFLGDGPALDGIGVAAFGPVVLEGPDRGLIGITPKLEWQGARLLDPFQQLGDIPIGIDTDVGAAAIAELRVGAGRGVDSLFYVTVGTGIGGAYSEGDAPHHGHGHSEIGHLAVKRLPGDTFDGVCPFHGDCVEGMASGTALDARKATGQVDAIDLVAGYLGQLVASITYTFAPHRVAFGGGVMNAQGMVDAIREKTAFAINGYSTNPRIVDDVETYVVPAALGQDAGLIGASLLGTQAAERLRR